jgi:hypothetical protein
MISPRVADRIGVRQGAKRCVVAPWAGRRFCGEVATIKIAIGECKGASIDAIVAPDLPRGVDVATGHDALLGSVSEIRFGNSSPVISCVRRRRGWL